MPVEFRIDPAARVVHSRAWGDVREAELVEHATAIRELYASGALDGEWAQLGDFCDVTCMVKVPSSGVERMAHLNPWPPGTLRVFVAPQALVHGLLRMYNALSDGPRVHIVASRPDAQAYLAAHGHGGTDDR